MGDSKPATSPLATPPLATPPLATPPLATPPLATPPLATHLLDLFLPKINPDKPRESYSDAELLEIFNTYGNENSQNDGAKITMDDLHLIVRCRVTEFANTEGTLFKGVIEVSGKEENVFIKRVNFKTTDPNSETAKLENTNLRECISREKMNYGTLSGKSTSNEICKLKVAFVLKMLDGSTEVFVISEYCEGYTIRDFIKRVFPFSIVEPTDKNSAETIARKYATKFLIRLAIELLEIILWIHSNGYIYTDIRPDNFIVGIVDLPTTEAMWYVIFSRPRILRAIDFGALQGGGFVTTKPPDFYNKNGIRLKRPILRSYIVDNIDEPVKTFFGQPIVNDILPPYKIRSTDYKNELKIDNFFPSNYSFNLRFGPNSPFFSSAIIDAHGAQSFNRLKYTDIHGAWLLILSLIWYCAPLYNVVLIKFIVLLRGMIVYDNATSVWGIPVTDDFCKNKVLSYLRRLYVNDDFLAIDNTSNEANVSELNSKNVETGNTKVEYDAELRRMEAEIRRMEAECSVLRNRIYDVGKEIKDRNVEINNLNAQGEKTGPIYNEIATLFEGNPLRGGTRAKSSKSRRRKTTRRNKTTRRIGKK
jgi:hypothetical protein